jgi:hypothetical protein
MSTIVKNKCSVEGDKNNTSYRDEQGNIVGSCPTKKLAESCFEALRSGRHFEIYMRCGENAPLKLTLSRNRRSVVVRGCFGEFHGLVGLRYLAEKLNDVIRGCAANFEISLVELRFADQSPTANPGLLGSKIEKGVGGRGKQ